MANVFDVASYILNQEGFKKITAMKLQKLCYYSQVWSLVWDEKPLFKERIEAWGNGPVCPALYHWHSGGFIISATDGLLKECEGSLESQERETIDAVLRDYGKYTAQQLSDLTHSEAPWKDANATCPVSGHCKAEISHASMAEYYSGLPKELEVGKEG